MLEEGICTKRGRDAVQAMQEQHEPVPIHIRIDTQEQRSGIPGVSDAKRLVNSSSLLSDQITARTEAGKVISVFQVISHALALFS